MYLSIIVPCYNEENRIGRTIDIIIRYLIERRFKTELILVNDGSSDETLSLLDSINAKLSQNPFVVVKIISYDINQGKGYAVKQGIVKSTGKYILICDADLSTPISELDKLLGFAQTYDLVIGSRKQKDARVTKPQPLIRASLGKAFSFISKIILGVNVNDFTCGFKLIRKEPAKEIASKMLINRWAYDSELLKIATIQNFSIKEVGILWRNDARTKVRLLTDTTKSLFDLIRISYNSYLKKYD